jgi:pSer/pThr/pTyr-binding forkhead associated (FHA) protein
VPLSPLQAHAASPQELRERIAAERRGLPFLLFRDGSGSQRIVDLADAGAALTIGRRPSSDVALGWDEQVSRLHATLERVGEEWAITDDGLSRNGTWVNGQRVAARRRLSDGDTIVIGGTAIAFVWPNDASVSSPTITALHAAVPPRLTPAQRRVLVALCRPFKDAHNATPATNQQIASELFVSVDAVKSTLRQLFEAFGVEDLPQNQKRATLALRAMRTGAVTQRDF